MPSIDTKVSVKITKEKEEALKSKLGKAIELIPGKSEDWLMLSFQDECTMYFKGSKQEPVAFVEVKILGKATNDAYDRLTAAITDALQEELCIPSSQIYVKYEEVEHWGWNGKNF